MGSKAHADHRDAKNTVVETLTVLRFHDLRITNTGYRTQPAAIRRQDHGGG
jgi:hypothetical protein